MKHTPALNRRRILLGLAAGTTLPLVQGCAPLFVGGAATGAVVAYNDRRTSGAMVEDEGIEWRTRRRLRERFGNAVNISVTSYNRTVLLTGQVPYATMRDEAQQIAAQVENVQGMVNELQVSGLSTLSERSNDAMLTSMVKARLVDDKRLAANHIKVVTEVSTVYLMGIVTQPEAEAATEVARTTRGVQKVVRVFEIISAEQAAKFDAGNKTSNGN
ncbi:MAG: BON domain-containing protein [Pseudazoarcus pumilus]|nr:BON domain-containing protein [Pseudazoarcus pumilus]